MSTWELIERRLNDSVIPVFLTNEEFELVKEAMSSYIKARLTESSAWDVYEQLSEAVSVSVPVKGLGQQHVEFLKKRFPQLSRANFKSGNTGTVLMLDADTWKNIRDQISNDASLRGLTSAEETLEKIDSALKLVMPKAQLTPGKAPELGGKASDPTAASTRATTFNEPSVSGDMPPRWFGDPEHPKKRGPAILRNPGRA